MKLAGVGLIAIAVVSGVAMLLTGKSQPPSNVVKYSGCTRLAKGPVCDIKPKSQLTFWLAGGPYEDLDFRFDNRPLLVKPIAVSGGIRFTVKDLQPGLLSLHASLGKVEHHFELKLQKFEPVKLPPGIRTASTPEEFAKYEKWADANPGRVGASAYMRLVAAADRQGNVDKVINYLARAADQAASTGELSLESRARFARSFELAFRKFRTADAERELDRLASLPDELGDVAAYMPYYRAAIRKSVGDISRAMAEFRQAEQNAAAMGLDLQVHTVKTERAKLDRHLGHYGAALSNLQKVRDWARSNGQACAEARAATSISWVLLLMRDHGIATDLTPEKPLRRALHLYTEGCSASGEAQFVHLNLAFAALQMGRPDDAENWLKQAEAGSLAVSNRPWLDETRARIALARGNLRSALEATNAMIEVAHLVSGTDDLFRAYVLSADVLTRIGEFEKALLARQKAEDTLDRLAVSVPLVGARHSYLTARDNNVLGLAELFLARNQPAAALAAIRRARSRSLGWARVSQGLARLSPQDRTTWNSKLGEYRKLRTMVDREVESDWKRSAQELDAALGRRQAREARLSELLDEALSVLPATPKTLPIEADVLHLSWIRLRSGVTLLGQIGEDAFAVLWNTDGAELPREVERRLDNARRVVLHPYGELRGRALHMLKVKGRPLAAEIETMYALDLPPVGDASLPQAALVVVDPDAEFLHGQDEVSDVTTALSRGGAHVDTVRGDVTEVRARLGSVDWFHFGGHGRWSPEDPMAGGLALADGARLGLGDILAAPKVPATVILTSCEAGRSAGRGGEAFGIAHAFLVAGARVVVAPDREVTDEEAARFASAFYRGTGDGLARYRAAIGELGELASAFRVFVP